MKEYTEMLRSKLANLAGIVYSMTQADLIIRQPRYLNRVEEVLGSSPSAPTLKKSLLYSIFKVLGVSVTPSVESLGITLTAVGAGPVASFTCLTIYQATLHKASL
jgi:hypothetical protein